MDIVRTRTPSLPLLGAALGAPLLGWVAVNHPSAIAGAVFAAPVFFLLVWSLTRPLAQAVVVYLVVYAFADTFKRVIAIFAEDAPIVQLVPFGIRVCMVLAIGARGLAGRMRRGRLDGIDRAMLAFLACTSLGVLVASDFPVKAKAVALALGIGPYLAFFAYREIAVSAADRMRFLRALIVIAVVAAVYGLAQSHLGPSWIDRAWAARSHAFSIQASNVWQSMNEGAPLRPYSVFADHFTFGYFSVAGLVALLATGWPRHRSLRLVCAGVLLAALSVALTRTAWAALVAIVVTGIALERSSRFRRVLPLAVLPLYFAVTFGIDLVYERVFPMQTFQSETMARAFSVGSLHARRDGLLAMGNAVAEYPVLGDAGDASGSYALRAKFSGHLASELEDPLFNDAHNFLVDKVVRAGAPGLLALLVFLLLVLRRTASFRGRACWYSAAACGLLLSGVAASDTMVSGFFVAWYGFVAGTPVGGEVPDA